MKTSIRRNAVSLLDMCKAMLALRGEEEQMLKTVEELNELSSEAINTYFITQKRVHVEKLYSLASEVADVETMLTQMSIVFGFTMRYPQLDEEEKYEMDFGNRTQMMESVSVINSTASMLIDYVLGLKEKDEVSRQLEGTLLHIMRIKVGIPQEIQFKARVAKAKKFKNYLEVSGVTISSAA